MFKKFLIVLTLFSAIAGGAAQSADRQADYRLIVPKDWKLLPRDPSSNERRFVSPTGDAWLSLYSVRANTGSITAHMDQLKNVRGERITYERQKANWIVVSGFRSDRIFYRKAMLACDNREWHHIAFEYPASQKRAFDRFVTLASYALDAYQHVGCRPTR